MFQPLNVNLKSNSVRLVVKITEGREPGSVPTRHASPETHRVLAGMQL